MRRRYFLGALTLAAAAAFAAPGPAAADALDDIIKAKLIKIAVPQDFAPFGSAGPDLKPVGYDIDMANLIGKELGAKVELVPVNSANRIPYLQTGKVHLVISSLGKNPEREKVIDFSKAYAPFFQGVFGLKDAKISKPEDLADKTIGATRGSIEEQEISKLAPSSTTVKRYEDNNATIAAFLSGQVDIIATGNVVAAAIPATSPARPPVTKFVIQESPSYIGMNQSEPKRLATINQIIAKAKAAGERNKIREEWLKAPQPAGI
jgi:polar amino acid transport system substrate-binding protein